MVTFYCILDVWVSFFLLSFLNVSFFLLKLHLLLSFSFFLFIWGTFFLIISVIYFIIPFKMSVNSIILLKKFSMMLLFVLCTFLFFTFCYAFGFFQWFFSNLKKIAKLVAGCNEKEANLLVWAKNSLWGFSVCGEWGYSEIYLLCTQQDNFKSLLSTSMVRKIPSNLHGVM